MVDSAAHRDGKSFIGAGTIAQRRNTIEEMVLLDERNAIAESEGPPWAAAVDYSLG